MGYSGSNQHASIRPTGVNRLEAPFSNAPTSDYAAFDMMLEDLYAGIIPVGGTDLSRRYDVHRAFSH